MLPRQAVQDALVALQPGGDYHHRAGNLALAPGRPHAASVEAATYPHGRRLG